MLTREDLVQIKKIVEPVQENNDTLIRQSDVVYRDDFVTAFNSSFSFC